LIRCVSLDCTQNNNKKKDGKPFVILFVLIQEFLQDLLNAKEYLNDIEANTRLFSATFD